MKQIVEEPPQAPLIDPSGVRTIETPKLLDVVVADGYVGPAWVELQRRFVIRSLSDLIKAIANGAIYRRCANAGVPISRRAELQVHPYPNEIASEAVEDCLERFQSRVLPEGQWNPERGVILEDFFAICCLKDVANRWRWYLRRLKFDDPLETVEETQILSFRTAASSDPALVIEHRDQVRSLLTRMTPEDQFANALLADGWCNAEIAHHLGLTRDALYARTSRARKIAQTRREL